MIIIFAGCSYLNFEQCNNESTFHHMFIHLSLDLLPYSSEKLFLPQNWKFRSKNCRNDCFVDQLIKDQFNSLNSRNGYEICNAIERVRIDRNHKQPQSDETIRMDIDERTSIW